mgnify:CR=1 FL=1
MKIKLIDFRLEKHHYSNTTPCTAKFMIGDITVAENIYTRTVCMKLNRIHYTLPQLLISYKSLTIIRIVIQ